MAEVQDYIPDFKTEVFDISHIPDEQIKGEVLLRVHFMMLKYIQNKDFFNKIHEIFEMYSTLSQKSKATEYLEVLLRYMVSSVDSNKTEDLKMEIKKVFRDGGNTMPTIAEKWVQDGVLKGKIEDAEKMVEEGFTNTQIRNITGLSIKKIQEIRKSVSKK